MNELQQVVADLRSEGDQLHRLLDTLRANDWSRTTRFKRWTIADVIAHLYFGDYLGITSHRDADEFRAFMANVQRSGVRLDGDRPVLRRAAGGAAVTGNPPLRRAPGQRRRLMLRRWPPERS